MPWTTENLRDRYDRGRELSKDFTIGDSGEFYFNSSESPQGYWIVRRRSQQLYSCNCPDYSSEKYQNLMKVTRPFEWQYRQWLGGDDDYQRYVPDCIHILAVRNFLHEVDSGSPFPQLLTPKTGLSKPDCGCGNTSKPCACQKKSLASLAVIPEKRLLGGCPTRCYVPSLTPPQQTVPLNDNPNWDTTRSQLPQLALQVPVSGCSGKAIDIRIIRLGNPDGYLQGFVTIYYNDLDTPVDGFEFVLKPNLNEYVYSFAIPQVGSAEFFFKLEAPIVEVVAPDTQSVLVDECPPCGSEVLGDESDVIPCIGSYQALAYTTGNTLSDGSCETVTYYRYDPDSCPFPPFPDPDPDNPFPDFPPYDPYPEDPDPDFPPIPPRPRFPPIPGGDCIATIYRDCELFDPLFPECAAFNYKGVLCGNDGTTSMLNNGGICTEECNKYCIEIDIPQCENPPCPKAAWACPNKDRYIGWFSQDSMDGNYDLGKPPLLEYFPSGSVDTAVYDSFYCKAEGKVYVLLGYSIPPQAYLKAGGCIDTPAPVCKFNENLPVRPKSTFQKKVRFTVKRPYLSSLNPNLYPSALEVVYIKPAGTYWNGVIIPQALQTWDNGIQRNVIFLSDGSGWQFWGGVNFTLEEIDDNGC